MNKIYTSTTPCHSARKKTPPTCNMNKTHISSNIRVDKEITKPVI